MTDYILSLDKIQQKFIDPETNEQIDLPEAFGLGANPLKKQAPTVEREVKDLEQELHETNIKLLEHDINYLKKEVAELKLENKNWHKMWDKKKDK